MDLKNQTQKREIKFRAWDESQQYMAYQGTPDLETLQSFMHHYGDQHLMQFTGLKDKNAVEIYEGDILKVQEPYNGNWSKDGAEVVFSNDYVGGWVISNAKQNLNLGTRQIYLEIIGNIYENPDCKLGHIYKVVGHVITQKALRDEF